jgi:hypothetical protein
MVVLDIARAARKSHGDACMDLKAADQPGTKAAGILLCASIVRSRKRCESSTVRCCWSPSGCLKRETSAAQKKSRVCYLRWPRLALVASAGEAMSSIPGIDPKAKAAYNVLAGPTTYANLCFFLYVGLFFQSSNT